jgi:hypothetical protein
MQKLLQTLLLILLTAATATVAAAPTAYSINSDSGHNQFADSLYRIDMGTGTVTRIATVNSLGQVKRDIEGLAFAPDGTLYGIDDESLTLFPLNTDNAGVNSNFDVPIRGLPTGGQNDFGMTFGCDNTLYISSVTENSLYRMGLDGETDLIGLIKDTDGFNVKISALAAYGNPVELYGLGNGLEILPNSDLVPGNPYLYRINTDTGVATELGAIGAEDYLEGGLSFDDSGQLWAITDRRLTNVLVDVPSQVMKINKVTGAATEVKDTKYADGTAETGFESLAITVPRGCDTSGGAENARFTVQKQFVDENDGLPVELNLRCYTGLSLEQSFTVQPEPGPFGSVEVKFVVDAFESGALDCEVFETQLDDYTPSYDCFSVGTCTTTASKCLFEGVEFGQEDLCTIRNYPNPVSVTVTKEWLYKAEDLVSIDSAVIDLYCRNAVTGDGRWEQGEMHWSWRFDHDTPSQTALVSPDFNGETECRTEERVFNSSVESLGDCEEWTAVPPGSGTLDCTVINTVFFEGIPTLNQYGQMLAALLLLLTGLFAVRRF